MKNVKCAVIFAVLLVLASNAFAQDPEVPVGSFKFSSDFELSTVKKFETVNTLTSQGKQRHDLLRNSGWTCVQQTSASLRCSIFLKGEKLPAVISQRIQAKYENLSLVFAAAHNLNLTNETDLLREYIVSQKVDVDENKIATYLLRESLNAPTKIQMDVGLEKLYLVILDEKTLMIQETNIIQEKNSSTLYVVQVLLEKSGS